MTSKAAAAGPAARTLFSGDFHPFLEEAFLEHVTGAIGEHPLDPVTVVVPTNFLAIRLKRLLAERAGGHVNVRFLNLRDLARSSAPSPLPGRRAPLPPRGDAVIVRRILEGGAARGGYFGAIAERPGLATVMLGAIRDLKEASYDPDSFAAAAAAVSLARGGKRNKFAEIASVWREYESFLARERFADDSDAMRAAAERLETEGAASDGATPDGPSTGKAVTSGRGALGRVILYGFYDLNALQKRLVRAAIGDGGATVFFPYADVPAYVYAEPTLDWFISLGFERVNLDPDPADLPLPEEVVVLSAPGEAREVREITRRLRDLVEGRDLALQDVGIIVRTPEAYSDILGAELDGLCDPGLRDRRLAESRRSFLESSTRLSRTRTGVSILKLAQAVRTGFARRDLVEFLSVADLNPASCGGIEGDPPVSEWNAISSHAGVTSGAAEWTERTRALAERLEVRRPGDSFAETHAGLAEPARALEGLLSCMLPPLTRLGGPATLDGHLDIFLDTFKDITRPGRERDEVLAAAESMRAVSPLAGEVSFGYFVEVLGKCVDVSTPRGSRFGIGGPSALSSMSARGLSYRVVVVPGLVEKQFPLHRRQDPVLLDSERERLNEQAGHDPLRELPIRGRGASEERLLFRIAAGAARETLVLTYPRLDPATARPRVPSIFVLDALRAVTGDRQTYESLETSEFVDRVPLSRRFPASRTESLTREEFDGCSVLEAVHTGNARELAYLLTAEGALRSRLEMELTRWSNPFFTKYDGALTSSAALEAARAVTGFGLRGPEPGKGMSATALEEYALCPFRFFVHRVLGIDPMEEPSDSLEFSPLDRGSLYHEVLERFLRRMKSEDRLPLSDSALDELFRTIDEATRSGQWNLAGYPGALALERRLLRLNLAVWLGRESRESGGFVPSNFEVRFGGEPRRGDDGELSSDERIPFDAGDEIRLEFTGRIDRVDVTSDGTHARVIDYKTGNPKHVNAPFDHGRHLQLPVYLLAAGELLARARGETASNGTKDGGTAGSGTTDGGTRNPGTAGRHATVDSAEYHFLTPKRPVAPVSFGAAELASRLDEMKAALRLIVHGISSGMFFPWPDEKSATCGNCDYAPACGKAALALASMKQGDPNAEFYAAELTEIE